LINVSNAISILSCRPTLLIQQWHVKVSRDCISRCTFSLFKAIGTVRLIQGPHCKISFSGQAVLFSKLHLMLDVWRLYSTYSSLLTVSKKKLVQNFGWFLANCDRSVGNVFKARQKPNTVTVSKTTLSYLKFLAF